MVDFLVYEAVKSAIFSNDFGRSTRVKMNGQLEFYIFETYNPIA